MIMRESYPLTPQAPLPFLFLRLVSFFVPTFPLLPVEPPFLPSQEVSPFPVWFSFFLSSVILLTFPWQLSGPQHLFLNPPSLFFPIFLLLFPPPWIVHSPFQFPPPTFNPLFAKDRLLPILRPKWNLRISDFFFFSPPHFFRSFFPARSGLEALHKCTTSLFT